ncbi:hypothetical protein LTR66_016331 [Elasticomyces elasticus]|nr:hypothetical protein LTR66_016331 [Elasticomyces elasticus]
MTALKRKAEQIDAEDAKKPKRDASLNSFFKASTTTPKKPNDSTPPEAQGGAPKFDKEKWAAGLTAALNVMRVAVQSESRLKSMPNNTVIMVSFAACFVLGLSTSKRGNQFYVAPSSKRQIQDAADTLQRIGSSPSHRNGASAMFGKHIKQIMRVHTALGVDVPEDRPHLPSMMHHQGHLPNGFTAAPFILQSPADAAQNVFPGFDSMTDDQLIAAIQNTSPDPGSYNNGFHAEDGVFMDWLDWPNMT